jgi:MFS family permease
MITALPKLPVPGEGAAADGTGLRSIMLARLRSTYHEYPDRFWVLAGAGFIDNIGRTMVFPFFALYVTHKFAVGMTEAGLLLAVFSVCGFAGNLVGGGLTDRFGRRTMLLIGLVISAISSVSMGLVNDLGAFFVLAAFVGFLSDIAGPARFAMVADLLPESQRGEGFGIMRVAGNLSWIIGPTVGGVLALRSYLLIFISDAVLSLITAVIVYRAIPETMPARPETSQPEDLGQTFMGYLRVLGDSRYLWFLAIVVVMNLIYIQLYSTFSVYLRDVHGIGPQGYGLLMTFNASLVVVAQFWVTRRIKDRPPLLMMALGSALYAVGFTLFGLVSAYALFVAAMMVVTVGEMVIMPVAQSLAAWFAPEQMRGRYMAVFGLAWAVPSAVGPWAAGLVMDNYNPHWVWWIGGVLATLAVLGFIALHGASRNRIQASEADLMGA